MISINGSQVLNSYLGPTNNTVLLQLGDVVNGDTDGQDAQYITPFGFASRPSQAVPGLTAGDATRIVGLGKRDFVIGGTDMRSQQIYGNLGFGEVTVFGGGSDGNAQGRISIKGDGSITLYTTDSNTASGNAVSLQLSPTGMTFAAPWGTWIFDATGFHVMTATGSSFDMSAQALPAPLSSLTSFIQFQAGQFVADCSMVKLGPTTGPCAPACVPLNPAQPAGVPIPPFASTPSSCVIVGL